jgi:polyhydroxybutyrate depolymerase
MDQTMPDITAAWAKRNGCESAASESTVTDDVVLVTFPCPAGHEVELYRVTDGGHAWPGSPGSVAIGAVTGRTTMSVNATELIWAFFKAHPIA